MVKLRSDRRISRPVRLSRNMAVLKRLPFRRSATRLVRQERWQTSSSSSSEPSSEEDLKRAWEIRARMTKKSTGLRKAIQRTVRQKNATKFLKNVDQIPEDVKPITLSYL